MENRHTGMPRLEREWLDLREVLSTQHCAQSFQAFTWCSAHCAQSIASSIRFTAHCVQSIANSTWCSAHYSVRRGLLQPPHGSQHTARSLFRPPHGIQQNVRSLSRHPHGAQHNLRSAFGPAHGAQYTVRSLMQAIRMSVTIVVRQEFNCISHFHQANSPSCWTVSLSTCLSRTTRNSWGDNTVSGFGASMS